MCCLIGFCWLLLRRIGLMLLASLALWLLLSLGLLQRG